jgi:hypothetical protein
MSGPDSIGLAFPGELARCQELLARYGEIGPAGAFGAAMIQAVVARAIAAWESGDPVAIVKAFMELRGCA